MKNGINSNVNFNEKKQFLFLGITLILILAISFDKILIAQETEEQRAKKMFRSFMLSAHPLPQKNAVNHKYPVPLTAPVNNPIFLNYNMIDSEPGETYKMQNESSIAVNPVNPKQLIGSAVDYRDTSSTWVYYSEDYGKTWINHNLKKPFPNWRSTNDPSVAYDPDGNAYLVYGGFGNIDDSTHGESFGENGVFISISTNGGTTWEKENTHIPVILHKGAMTIDSTFEDKYYISIDNSQSSPYRNNLYIPWKRVSPKDSATQIVFSKSIDKGRTWSLPIPVSPRKSGTSQDTTYGQSFPLVATGPEGEVYLIWNDGIVHGVGFAKSLDGGNTFSQPEIIQNYDIFGKTNDLRNTGEDIAVWRHTLKEIVRAEAYPVIVVDTTKFSNRGTLYLTWAADNPPNIYFSKSTDKGAHWTTPVIIHNDTSNNDQFWQWMAVDPMNGDLAVMYLDSRDDPDNLMVECYVSYSRDGGNTWIDRKISDFNSDIRRNPFGNHFAGDYSGMAFYFGKIYPSWVDMRNALTNIYDSDVFTAFTNIWLPSPVKNFNASSVPEKTDEIELTWDKPAEYIFGQPMSQDKFNYFIELGNDTISLPSGQTNYTHNNLIKHKKYNYNIYVISGADTSIVSSDSAYAGGSRELSAANILSANGSESNDIELKINLPEFRADMETKLLNLSSIVLYDNNDNLLSQKDLIPGDAGKEIELNYNPQEKGYYKLYTKVFDDEQPQNESNKSNTINVFTGQINSTHTDNFDSGLYKYDILNTWNITSDFSHSSGFSLTDSPEGNYKDGVENHLSLFPVLIEENQQLNIEFWHAAIVDKRDTAKVEYSTDMGESWNYLIGFSENDYSFWSDNTRDQQDWKFEKITIPFKTKDTITIKFSLGTKQFNTKDGWYIDDLNIYSEPVGVEESQQNHFMKIFPNPATEIVNIYLNDRKNNDLKYFMVTNNLGTKFNLPISESNNNLLLLDVSQLPQGIYFITLEHESKIERTKFLKIE